VKKRPKIPLPLPSRAAALADWRPAVLTAHHRSAVSPLLPIIIIIHTKVQTRTSNTNRSSEGRLYALQSPASDEPRRHAATLLPAAGTGAAVASKPWPRPRPRPRAQAAAVRAAVPRRPPCGCGCGRRLPLSHLWQRRGRGFRGVSGAAHGGVPERGRGDARGGEGRGGD